MCYVLLVVLYTEGDLDTKDRFLLRGLLFAFLIIVFVASVQYTQVYFCVLIKDML